MMMMMIYSLSHYDPCKLYSVARGKLPARTARWRGVSGWLRESRHGHSASSGRDRTVSAQPGPAGGVKQRTIAGHPALSRPGVTPGSSTRHGTDGGHIVSMARVVGGCSECMVEIQLSVGAPYKAYFWVGRPMIAACSALVRW